MILRRPSRPPSLLSAMYLYACASACGPTKDVSVAIVGHAALHSPHLMHPENWTNRSRSSGVCTSSLLAPSGTSVSSLTMNGFTLRWSSNSLSNPTARSLTTGKFLSGSTVIVPAPSSSIFVKHARRGLPLIIMPQEPHVACLQEYLTPTEWSMCFLTSSMASRTVVHFSTGTVYVANSLPRPSAGFSRAMRSVTVRAGETAVCAASSAMPVAAAAAAVMPRRPPSWWPRVWSSTRTQ